MADRQTKNKVVGVVDGTITIELTRGYTTMLSDTPAMWELLKKHRFNAKKDRGARSYAATNAVGRNGKYTTVKMHQLICPTIRKDEVVDHKNHNTLDNRIENLHLVSFRENGINQRGLRSDSTTGETCVYRATNREAYFVRWQDENSAQQNKNFADSHYGGKEGAKLAAIKFRNEYVYGTVPVYKEVKSQLDIAPVLAPSFMPIPTPTSGETHIHRAPHREAWIVCWKDANNDRRNKNFADSLHEGKENALQAAVSVPESMPAVADTVDHD